MESLTSRHAPPAFLASCLLLGGSSVAGIAGNMLLQIAGLVLLVLVCWQGWPRLPDRCGRWFLILLAAVPALLLLELVPLPPTLWQALPGRGSVVAGYQLIGVALPWLPVSLAPDDTIAALCALIPAFAVALLTLQADLQGRKWIIRVVVSFALLSVVVGLLQRLGGPNSWFYFYQVTNRGVATGFFSNRNHLATLCLMAMPFVAVVLPRRRGSRHRQLIADRAVAGVSLAGGVVIAVLALGVAMTVSFSGLLMLVPVLAATWALYRRGDSGRRGRWLLWGALGLALLSGALVLVAPLSYGDVRSKVSIDNPRQRYLASRTSLEIARGYFPVGSGGGSFQLVFPMHEDPATVGAQFLNHVHDDYVETALEHGLAGLLLAIAAWAWWIAATRSAWRRDSPVDDRTRAATVAMAVVLVHSFVDYPARTAAIACLLAAAAALVARPGAASACEADDDKPDRRSRSDLADMRIIDIGLAPAPTPTDRAASPELPRRPAGN